MAYEIPGFTLGTLLANADLSSSQYLFGVVNSSSKIAVAGAGVAATGVINNAPTADLPVELIVTGVARVKASAAIAAGAKVASTAAGKAVTAATTAFVMGIALEAAGADNEIIAVLLHSPGHNALA